MVVKSLGGLGGDQPINIGVPAFQSTHLSNTGHWLMLRVRICRKIKFKRGGIEIGITSCVKTSFLQK